MASSALPWPGPDGGAAGSGAGAGTEDSASGSGLPEGACVGGGAGEDAEAVGDGEAEPEGVPPPSFGVQAGSSTAANSNAAMGRYVFTLSPPAGLSVMTPFYCRRCAGRLNLPALGGGCDEPHHGRVQLADLASVQAEAFHHGAGHLECLLPKGRTCRSEADGEGALIAVHPSS
jgi:hypothetical protein